MRDHVRSSIPSALATARFFETQIIEKTKLAAHDAGAASEAVELLRGAAPGAIERMDAALASAVASLAAIEESRKKKKKGGGSGSSSSPSPSRPPRPGGAGPAALLSSLYEAATGGGGGGGKKQLWR